MENTNNNNRIEFTFLNDIDLSSIAKDGTGSTGRWVNVLYEWINSGAKACKLTCANEAEKKKCKCALSNYIRSHNLDWTYIGERGTNNVYVVKA